MKDNGVTWSEKGLVTPLVVEFPLPALAVSDLHAGDELCVVLDNLCEVLGCNVIGELNPALPFTRQGWGRYEPPCPRLCARLRDDYLLHVV